MEQPPFRFDMPSKTQRVLLTRLFHFFFLETFPLSTPLPHPPPPPKKKKKVLLPTCIFVLGLGSALALAYLDQIRGYHLTDDNCEY